MRLDRAVRALERAIEDLRSNETYQLKAQSEEAKSRGEDLLETLHRDLRNKLNAARSRLNRVKEQFDTFVARFPNLFRT